MGLFVTVTTLRGAGGVGGGARGCATPATPPSQKMWLENNKGVCVFHVCVNFNFRLLVDFLGFLFVFCFVLGFFLDMYRQPPHDEQEEFNRSNSGESNCLPHSNRGDFFFLFSQLCT